MRVLIFHGYLLGGTGSNVYNANLIQAFLRLGYEVQVVCQERHPERFEWIDAASSWEGGRLTVKRYRESGRCTLYRPDIGGLLPVYVADNYEGITARTFSELSDSQLENYLEANVSAVKEVIELAKPDFALANHLVMGPVILKRAFAGSGIPYVVKIHGSALEYTVKPEPERFLPFAEEGLSEARTVLVGSTHVAESLLAAVGQEGLAEKVKFGPPGVDIEHFAPASLVERKHKLAGLRARLVKEATEDKQKTVVEGSSFERQPAASAAAVAEVAAAEGPLVGFLGKFIVSKGVDLLLAAWPLVLEGNPEARLVLTGFGAYRDGLQKLAEALAQGDLKRVVEIAESGRLLEGGERSELSYLLSFIDGLTESEKAGYLAAAAGMAEQLIWVGKIDHPELIDLMPSLSALVVPSTFPEAFGMVAAEAAACGVVPLCAKHSGLAEVVDALAEGLEPPEAAWFSFELGPDAVTNLAQSLNEILSASDEKKRKVSEAIAATVRDRYSWQSVAKNLIDVAKQ